MASAPDDVAPAIRRLREMHRRAARRAVAGALGRSIVSVTVLVAAYYMLPVDATTAPQIAARVLIGAAAIALVVTWQLRAINRSDLPQLRAIEALAIAVTLMVVLFASAYVTMSEHDVTAFNEPMGRTGALYFTLTTLTTVGYGDIYARTNSARIAVMLQMVFNVAVIGLAVKLILGTARNRMRSERDD